MTIKIIGIIIGILIFGGGIYYLSKEKNDAESKKIYMAISIIGIIIAAVCGIMAVL